MKFEVGDIAITTGLVNYPEINGYECEIVKIHPISTLGDKCDYAIRYTNLPDHPESGYWCINEKNLKKKKPVIVLLYCTLLYKSKREGKGKKPDDLRGKPVGHFLVVSGKDRNKYILTDPYPKNPFNKKGVYKVDKEELLANIHQKGSYALIIGKR